MALSCLAAGTLEKAIDCITATYILLSPAAAAAIALAADDANAVLHDDVSIMCVSHPSADSLLSHNTLPTLPMLHSRIIKGTQTRLLYYLNTLDTLYLCAEVWCMPGATECFIHLNILGEECLLGGA